jgi:acetyl esterase/lipase
MAPRFTSSRNLVYAEYPGRQMLLDLYRPETDRVVPTLLYFHGGGWKSGSKDICRLQWLTRYGFAVASVNFRLLPRFEFPTQLDDAKTAVRYLRGRAEELGLDVQRFAAGGQSAGAYLANMLGVTAGHAELDQPAAGEGPTSDKFADQPTAIRAVINLHGFTDLVALQREPSRRGLSRARRAPEGELLGHAVSERPERARLASPITHLPDRVGDNYPAFLHLHGDRDEITPLDQSRRFHAALLEAGADSKMTLVRGAGHNDRQLYDPPAMRDRIAHFLHRHLRTDGMVEVHQDARQRQEARREHRPAAAKASSKSTEPWSVSSWPYPPTREERDR